MISDPNPHGPPLVLMCNPQCWVSSPLLVLNLLSVTSIIYVVLSFRLRVPLSLETRPTLFCSKCNRGTGNK